MPVANKRNRKARLAATALVLAIVPSASGGAQPQLRLPDDQIQSFRVVGIQKNPTDYWDWDLRLEVYYYYSASHGKAIVGGELLPPRPEFQSGHSYWGTESGPQQAVTETRQGDIVTGMQRVNIAVHLNSPRVITNQIRLYLYVPQGGEFADKVFDYRREWRKPVVGPDLMIEGGTYEPASPVKPGTTVVFSLVVANRGSEPASGFIRVTGPGNISGGFPGGLRPGESKIAQVAYPVSSRGVTYRLRFTVDPDNLIRESNKANNTSREFVVRTLP